MKYTTPYKVNGKNKYIAENGMEIVWKHHKGSQGKCFYNYAESYWEVSGKVNDRFYLEKFHTLTDAKAFVESL